MCHLISRMQVQTGFPTHKNWSGIQLVIKYNQRCINYTFIRDSSESMNQPTTVVPKVIVQIRMLPHDLT